MSTKKNVSIWTAFTEWQPSILQAVMEPKYSEDGDFLGSEFSNVFSLGFTDDDTVEADKVETTNSLSKAVEGCSYDSDIIESIKKKSILTTEDPIDTIVAIYNYSFSGEPKSSYIREKMFFYRGSFEYED
ncbi:immunity 22 family protein [Pseudomonas viridiflava]|uniref:immunity 22 family protein n=1 Tax=Pseudomonas viridiflava TaxID=33069 RepID=UPI000F044B64|nr:immunity 22 family protein [Pseudomonas viridiflava]MCI3912756.1 immunity 22 family protein [Pseudomonas viridiflava]